MTVDFDILSLAMPDAKKTNDLTLDTLVWAVALLTPVRAAVRPQARSNGIFRPNCFSSTKNVYIFSTIFRASSLRFHLTDIFMNFLSLVTNKL